MVRSWHTSYAAGDRLAALDHYADDAIWYLNWWREPHVGRDAIRAELDRQHDGFANYRSEIVNLFSNDGVVFIEGIDTFTMGGKDATMHSVHGPRDQQRGEDRGPARLLGHQRAASPADVTATPDLPIGASQRAPDRQCHAPVYDALRLGEEAS